MKRETSWKNNANERGFCTCSTRIYAENESRRKERGIEKERERSRGVGEISIRVAGPGQKLGLRHGLEVGSHGLEREMRSSLTRRRTTAFPRSFPLFFYLRRSTVSAGSLRTGVSIPHDRTRPVVPTNHVSTSLSG